jgi:hypothetical protein
MRPYLACMAAASPRVKQIVELVSSLDENERTQLEDELRGEDLAIGRAWALEIDRRATRALNGEGETLSRDQLTALLGGEPEAARSALAQMLAARR